jgi:cytochrome c oxidase subunit 1
MPVATELWFMYATMVIAIPTGVKVFNWVATMWGGSMTFEAPMLFALGFVVMFTIGGFSGLMLAVAPVDFQYHDTFFVVAHLHYVLYPGAIFATMAAVYYWIPKWTGHMYDERLAKIHFWTAVIALNLTFFPMHFVGLAGMPRRIADYAIPFTGLNTFATLGAFLLGATQLLFLYIVIKTARGGPKATDQVWESATGLEWTVPSPAPLHTFEIPPKVD